MPGRNAHQARQNFLGPIQQSVSCLSRAYITFIGKTPGELEALRPSEDPIRLQSRNLGSLLLTLRVHYRIIQKEPGNWGARTTAYYYTIDDEVGEVISWQWHPETGNRHPHPHLHMTGQRTEKGLHTPTGRVSIEAVIRYLIEELGVLPTSEHRNDYGQVLDTCERNFIENRSWHA